MYRLYCNNGDVKEFNRRGFWLHLANQGQSIPFDKTSKKYQKRMRWDFETGSKLFYTRYKTIYAVN